MKESTQEELLCGIWVIVSLLLFVADFPVWMYLLMNIKAALNLVSWFYAFKKESRK